MADINLEEVNRLRVAMGMKPIETPGGPSTLGETFGETSDGEEPASTVETRQAAAGDNWNKLQEEEAAKAKRKAHKDAVKKARDQAQRKIKLTGKTLGDDDDDMDTAAWLRGQNKRQKKIETTRKKEEERATLEKQAEYTSKDLAGVKVVHQLDQFDSGEQILTLKDAIIGDESEDDELENTDLKAKEALEKKLELKKKKPVYDPNAEDAEASVLAQYDDEISGPKVQRFTLDGQGSIQEKALIEEKAAKYAGNGIIFSLDDLKDDKPVSDYLDISEIKVRKSKKSKKSKSRKKKAEEDDIFQNDDSAMAVDHDLSASRKRTYDDAEFLDEDLQERLNEQRRGAHKKKKRTRPEDMARELREEEKNKMDLVEEDEEGGLVFDQTKEFVDHLQNLQDREQESAEPRRHRTRSKSAAAQVSVDPDVEMTEDQSESAGRKVSFAEPINGSTMTSVLDDENANNNGVGATLKMLQSRKFVEEGTDGDLVAKYRNYDNFLEKKRQKEMDVELQAKTQRENDRNSGRFQNMSNVEKEALARQANINREAASQRAVHELFNKEYKPHVKLEYVDEYGRHMNPKEAFKHMSHQFHGKESGKGKTEKRLRKIEEERQRLKQNSIDSSQHGAGVDERARNSRQAGVRLQ